MTKSAKAAARRRLVNLSVAGVSAAAFGGAWLGIVVADTGAVQPAVAAGGPAAVTQFLPAAPSTNSASVTLPALVPTPAPRYVPTVRRSRAS